MSGTVDDFDDEMTISVNLPYIQYNFYDETFGDGEIQAQSNLDNAEENLKLADESFQAGVCSSSDLMAAQTAWLSAQSEVVDAQIEIAMSRVYLRQALGINQ